MIIRRARPTDYPAILQLQGENVPEALDESQKRQGFIVSRMNEAQLATINRGIGIWVAEQENQLAGFVCLMPAGGGGDAGDARHAILRRTAAE